MALLDDNQADRRIIARFEKGLMQLLQAHTDHQKQIIQLTAENKTLKALLEASNTDLNRSAAASHTALPLDGHQINKYIKEIDLCLAYFEQV